MIFWTGLSRCGKSCRLRWVNHLQPGVKRGNFTKEEEDLIIKKKLETSIETSYFLQLDKYKFLGSSDPPKF